MTKENNVQPLSNEDLKLWGTYLITKEIPEGKEKQIARLAKRDINIADTSALIKFHSDFVNQQQAEYLGFLSERVALLEYILVDKLEISQEDLEAYGKKFTTELDELEAAYEAAQEELEKEGEEKDGE